MVTHEREVAEHGDRIIHLRDGNIVSEEKVEVKRMATDERLVGADDGGWREP
jgi:ABC-type uncharacterized transport system ATPase component